MLEKVAKILAEQLDIDVDTINADTRIADDLNADSLDVVEMLMAIEDEFDITISETEVGDLKTVGDVAEFLKEKTGLD